MSTIALCGCQNSTEYLNAIDFCKAFDYVVGFPETKANLKALQFEKNNDDGCFYLKNSKTGQSFCCGKIEFLTLKDLRKRYADVVNRECAGNASFTVLCYTGIDKSKFHECDVCALQADPSNSDAVFQLASRMHGLEGGCVYKGENTEHGLGFNRMLVGPTQGEYSSLSAAPGTIYKMYGYEPINLLGNTELAALVNPEKSGGNMPKIEKILEIKNISNKWTDDLRIYFHENIDVIAGMLLSDHFRKPAPSNQRIHQIPVAAFDWRRSNKSPVYSGLNMADTLESPKKEQLRNITGQMLNGFYEGTLLATVLKSKKKLFLTAVGGGAFQNDRDLIVNAIANEKNLEIITKNKLNVVLVVHDSFEKANQWKIFMNNFFENKKGIIYTFKML